jgi:hypothetical protein
MKGLSMRKTFWCTAALVWPSVLLGQSCTITSPSSGQLFQTAAPLKLTAAIASAPRAYSIEYDIDNLRWAKAYARDPHDINPGPGESWAGPFTSTWYTGLNGDGGHFISATVRDIFGTTLATCPTVNFNVRLQGMSNQSATIATSGSTGNADFLDFDGVYGGVIRIDGRDNAGGTEWTGIPISINGGIRWQNLQTTRFPNGPRLVEMISTLTGGLRSDPLVKSQTFSSANVSGNNIALTGHYLTGDSVVVLSTTGTLPSPLAAGAQWLWTGSNTVTLSVASGVMTFTCSSACGVTAGTPVYVRNIPYTNQVTGQPGCDGYYMAASGSGTSFTVSAPSTCPNGITGASNGSPGGCVKSPPGNICTGAYAGTSALEVDVNPYFAQYVNANTVSLAATPAGATITLGGGGTGTHTITTRLRSPWWTSTGDNGSAAPNVDYVRSGPSPKLRQLVTFANGNAPQELRPPYWEYHLIAGGATASACPVIENTDGTQTAPSGGCGGTTGLTYTEVDDGGLSGVCSVDSSGHISPLMAGWCRVQIACISCAAGGVTLPTVTVYVQVHSGSITFPHFTTCGVLATAFDTGLPSGCHSFFPISVWQLDPAFATGYDIAPATRTLWVGPMMQESNINSTMFAFNAGNNLITPTGTSCPNWSDPAQYLGYTESFANTWNTFLEFDNYQIYFFNGSGGGITPLAYILGNLGFDRQSCLQSLVTHQVNFGRYWRYYNDDELSFTFGANLMPNPAIGGANWTSATTSGGVITFHVSGINTPSAWNQSTGGGNAIQITGATTNSCMNGWLLLTSTSSTTWTAPAGPCGNGLTINSESDPGAKMIINPSSLESQHNISWLPASPSTATQVQMGLNGLNSIDCTATPTCTVNYTGHNIPNGRAIRISGASSAHLNIIAPITVVNANSFTITYPNTTGGLAPASSVYNASTDGALKISIDPGWGPNPLGQFYSLINAVPNHPITSFSMLGSLFNTANGLGVYSYEGNPANTASAFDYVPSLPTDSAHGWATYTDSSSGIVTRAWQLKPRSMLASAGIYSAHYCQSFQEFNPDCDRPEQLFWQPEYMVAQIVGMLTRDASALRLYNFTSFTNIIYSNTCCGWQGNGTGTGQGISPATAPKMWSAYAHTNALIHLREDTHLEPEANKPYLGPMFFTDAHTSTTYGNELMILCGSETPYGPQTVALNRIGGGSTLKYVLDGYSLRVSLVPNNPSSDAEEFCSTPGRTTVFVSQPPGRNALDNITFAPPAPLPFGASKMLIQVGYYPKAMEDDPVTDCTSACIIAVDHHNTAAWYRIIYADSNFLPRSIGDPVRIPSQGLD